jgi:DHA2 family methylenomycin A resistance protein-like MFS transporter
LTSSWGWQSIFWINVPIGLLGIVLTLFVGSDRGWTVGRHLDLMGQGLAAICLISAIGVLIEGPELGWSSASIIIGGMVAIIALVGFVLAEKRHLEPMLPLMIFKNSAFAGIAIVTVMGTMAWFGMLFVLSLYFQKERGLTPFQTGLAFLPGTAVVILGNILFGRLVGRMGLRWVLLAGTVAQAVGFFGILLIQQGTSYVWIAICLLVLGLGGGLRTPAAAAAVINSVAGAHVGIAAGVLNASRQVGAALGVALFGSFIVEAQALGTGVRLSAAVSFAASAVSVAIMFYALKKDES